MIVTTRHAFDDRKGAPTSSPFRSKAEAARYRAAAQMISKRLGEIAALEKLIARTTDPASKRRFQTRLLATSNNLQSWLDYLDVNEAPREPRAVITPAA